MTETVSIPEGANYILVRSEGAPSFNEMKQTLSRLSELITQNNINRILVDGRLRKEHPGVSDIYSGGELLAKTFGYKIKVAVLVSEIESSHSFFANVAVNRGANVVYFVNEDKALTWLMKGTG